MRRVRIEKADGSVLIPDVWVAVSGWERMRGLLGRQSLGAGRGMWFPRCGAIHTLFMRFDLDLVFLDAGDCVVRIVRRVRPFRMVFGGLNARSVLELESGWLPEGAFSPRERVSLRPLP